MKILVAGDTHGDPAWTSRLCKYAHKRGCDRIVQLGDFGYWEHTDDGRKFLRSVSNQAKAAGIDFYFIDGNHENHPLLWEKYPPNADGFCELRPQLFYIPRGHSFEWDGVRFLALGGAYSIDKGWRVREETFFSRPRTLWWPTETIALEDAERAQATGPCDVMFTHDCPWGVDLPNIDGRFIESNINRKLLATVVRETLPKLVVHGHYHMRNSGRLEIRSEVDGVLQSHEVRVEGYDCNTRWNEDSWGVLDTDAVKRL